MIIRLAFSIFFHLQLPKEAGAWFSVILIWTRNYPGKQLHLSVLMKFVIIVLSVSIFFSPNSLKHIWVPIDRYVQHNPKPWNAFRGIWTSGFLLFKDFRWSWIAASEMKNTTIKEQKKSSVFMYLWCGEVSCFLFSLRHPTFNQRTGDHD